MQRCLGIDIKQTVQNNTLTDVTLSQEKYIINILNQFGYNNSKPVYTPAVPNTFLISNMPDTTDTPINNDTISQSTTEVTAVSAKSYPSLVGSLLWIALQTRPEISQAKIWSHYDSLMAVTGTGGAKTSALYRVADQNINSVLRDDGGPG